MPESGLEEGGMCSVCHYYVVINEEYGQCRRYPPKVFEPPMREVNYFPVTAKGNWCGEYVLREQ